MRAEYGFTLATLGPLPLLIAGALWCGLWIALALLALTVLLFTLDHIARAASPSPEV